MSAEPWSQTRHSLLGRIKDWGDEASWEDFSRTYSKLIYDTAIRASLTDAEAKDVVQETLLTVAKKIQDFHTDRSRGSFRVWLLQTTRWRIADQLRKRRHSMVSADFTSEEGSQTSVMHRIPDPASFNLEADWNERWHRNLADAALQKIKNQVDPAQYQMFDLHIIQEWRARQVAEKLGVKIRQVYFASYKISRALRKEIKRMEAQFG
jgi:RNA polymerase sigma-70 factor (ECF subfamily)